MPMSAVATGCAMLQQTHCRAAVPSSLETAEWITGGGWSPTAAQCDRTLEYAIESYYSTAMQPMAYGALVDRGSIFGWRCRHAR